MHKLTVGIRYDELGDPAFFGWDKVNDYIPHGME